MVSSVFDRDQRTGTMEQHLATSRLAISPVTVAEMRSGALRARWGAARLSSLEEHLRAYSVLPIDSAVAEEWARLLVRCLELGRPKGENDLWVAATAKRHEIPLATLDPGQQDIPGLTVIREDGTETTTPA